MQGLVNECIKSKRTRDEREARAAARELPPRDVERLVRVVVHAHEAVGAALDLADRRARAARLRLGHERRRPARPVLPVQLALARRELLGQELLEAAVWVARVAPLGRIEIGRAHV